MVWMGIAIALPMTFLSDWLVNLLYGEEYNQSASVLIIHIWAGIFIFLLVASGKWLINENLSKQALNRNLAGVVINILLNYFLIKNFGIIGAAYATLISYAIAGFFYDIFSKKLRNNFYLKLNAFFLVFRLLRK